MISGEDESSVNGRLRPRKSTATAPVTHSKSSSKPENKLAQDKPKRNSTPSKAPPNKQDDLTAKADSSFIAQFLCPFCDKTFSSKLSATKHSCRIHLSASKQDKFVDCLYCNFSDASSTDVIRHMVDRHPNQYFACLDCNTRFYSTLELAEHKLNVCEKQKQTYRSKLRQKASPLSKKEQKKIKTDEKSTVVNESSKEPEFNGLVISCELKPSLIHDTVDIEDKITTNLILPSNINNPGMDKNAVIILEDVQWNKRMPPNFSFRNADADQILSRLGVVHRSPRVGETTRKEWLKMMDDSSQKFEKCFDTNFYSRVASNVQENLARFLDGSFNFSPDPDKVIKTRKSKSSAIINTAEGFPILLPQEQYSRNRFDGYMPRAIAPKHKWKWGSAENVKTETIIIDANAIKRDTHVDNCIITLVSSLDIWTQIRMRHKFEEIFCKVSAEKSDKQNIISMQLKEILESREIPSTSRALDNLSSSPSAVTLKNTMEFPNFLGLTARGSSTAEIASSAPAVLSGEWVRPRCYVCCACGQQNREARALSTHMTTHHPNAQVQHYEIVGESLLNADILKHLYVPPSQMSNRTRPLRGFRDCTKCKKSITMEDLHQHMLDCAGDTPTVRRKCRTRLFGVRRRRPRLPDSTTRKKIRKDIKRTRHNQKKLLRARPRIRSEVGDAETIRKMIADLPAKRHRSSNAEVNSNQKTLRPRLKLDKQRSKIKVKIHTSKDRPPNKNNLKIDSDGIDEDDQPLKPKSKNDRENTVPANKRFSTRVIASRNKKETSVAKESSSFDNKQQDPSGSSASQLSTNQLSRESTSQRLNINSTGSNKSDADNSENSEKDNEDDEREKPPRDNRDKDKGATPNHTLLKHSITNLTASTSNKKLHSQKVIDRSATGETNNIYLENVAGSSIPYKPPLQTNQKKTSEKKRLSLLNCIEKIKSQQKGETTYDRSIMITKNHTLTEPPNLSLLDPHPAVICSSRDESGAAKNVIPDNPDFHKTRDRYRASLSIESQRMGNETTMLNALAEPFYPKINSNIELASSKTYSGGHRRKPPAVRVSPANNDYEQASSLHLSHMLRQPQWNALHSLDAYSKLRPPLIQPPFIPPPIPHTRPYSEDLLLQLRTNEAIKNGYHLQYNNMGYPLPIPYNTTDYHLDNRRDTTYQRIESGAYPVVPPISPRAWSQDSAQIQQHNEMTTPSIASNEVLSPSNHRVTHKRMSESPDTGDLIEAKKVSEAFLNVSSKIREKRGTSPLHDTNRTKNVKEPVCNKELDKNYTTDKNKFDNISAVIDAIPPELEIYRTTTDHTTSMAHGKRVLSSPVQRQHFGQHKLAKEEDHTTSKDLIPKSLYSDDNTNNKKGHQERYLADHPHISPSVPTEGQAAKVTLFSKEPVIRNSYDMYTHIQNGEDKLPNNIQISPRCGLDIGEQIPYNVRNEQNAFNNESDQNENEQPLDLSGKSRMSNVAIYDRSISVVENSMSNNYEDVPTDLSLKNLNAIDISMQTQAFEDNSVSLSLTKSMYLDRQKQKKSSEFTSCGENIENVSSNSTSQDENILDVSLESTSRGKNIEDISSEYNSPGQNTEYGLLESSSSSEKIEDILLESTSRRKNIEDISTASNSRGKYTEDNSSESKLLVKNIVNISSESDSRCKNIENISSESTSRGENLVDISLESYSHSKTIEDDNSSESNSRGKNIDHCSLESTTYSNNKKDISSESTSPGENIADISSESTSHAENILNLASESTVRYKHKDHFTPELASRGRTTENIASESAARGKNMEDIPSESTPRGKQITNLNINESLAKDDLVNFGSDEPACVTKTDTCVSEGAASVSEGAASVSDRGTCVSDGAICVSEGATCVSDGALCVSDGAACFSDKATTVSEGAACVADRASYASDEASCVAVSVTDMETKKLKDDGETAEVTKDDKKVDLSQASLEVLNKQIELARQKILILENAKLTFNKFLIKFRLPLYQDGEETFDLTLLNETVLLQLEAILKCCLSDSVSNLDDISPEDQKKLTDAIIVTLDAETVKKLSIFPQELVNLLTVIPKECHIKFVDLIYQMTPEKRKTKPPRKLINNNSSSASTEAYDTTVAKNYETNLTVNTGLPMSSILPKKRHSPSVRVNSHEIQTTNIAYEVSAVSVSEKNTKEDVVDKITKTAYALPVDTNDDKTIIDLTGDNSNQSVIKESSSNELQVPKIATKIQKPTKQFNEKTASLRAVRIKNVKTTAAAHISDRITLNNDSSLQHINEKSREPMIHMTKINKDTNAIIQTEIEMIQEIHSCVLQTSEKIRHDSSAAITPLIKHNSLSKNIELKTRIPDEGVKITKNMKRHVEQDKTQDDVANVFYFGKDPSNYPTGLPAKETVVNVDHNLKPEITSLKRLPAPGYKQKIRKVNGKPKRLILKTNLHDKSKTIDEEDSEDDICLAVMVKQKNIYETDNFATGVSVNKKKTRKTKHKNKSKIKSRKRAKLSASIRLKSLLLDSTLSKNLQPRNANLEAVKKSNKHEINKENFIKVLSDEKYCKEKEKTKSSRKYDKREIYKNSVPNDNKGPGGLFEDNKSASQLINPEGVCAGAVKLPEKSCSENDTKVESLTLKNNVLDVQPLSGIAQVTELNVPCVIVNEELQVDNILPNAIDIPVEIQNCNKEAPRRSKRCKSIILENTEPSNITIMITNDISTTNFAPAQIEPNTSKEVVLSAIISDDKIEDKIKNIVPSTTDEDNEGEFVNSSQTKVRNKRKKSSRKSKNKKRKSCHIVQNDDESHFVNLVSKNNNDIIEKPSNSDRINKDQSNNKTGLENHKKYEFDCVLNNRITPEKRKSVSYNSDSQDDISKPKISKFENENLDENCDQHQESVDAAVNVKDKICANTGNSDSILSYSKEFQKQPDKTNTGVEIRTACYNRPIVNKLTDLASIHDKKPVNYDPYDIDLDFDIVETTRPIVKRKGNRTVSGNSNMRNSKKHFVSENSFHESEISKNIPILLSHPIDSDSSISDTPLQKYVEEKEKSRLESTKDVKDDSKEFSSSPCSNDHIAANNNEISIPENDLENEIVTATNDPIVDTNKALVDDVNSIIKDIKEFISDQQKSANNHEELADADLGLSIEKNSSKQRKSRRSQPAPRNEPSTSNDNDEQLSSEICMKHFGFYNTRQPRKSNILATKKIAETFNMIENEEAYYQPRERQRKTSHTDSKKASASSSVHSSKAIPEANTVEENIEASPSTSFDTTKITAEFNPVEQDGEVDLITAKIMLESEEIRKLEEDLYFGFKEAAEANVGKTSGLNYLRAEEITTENSEQYYASSSGTNVLIENTERVEQQLITSENSDDELSPKIPDITEALSPEITEALSPEMSESPESPESSEEGILIEKPLMYPEEEVNIYEDKYDIIKRRREANAKAKQLQELDKQKKKSLKTIKKKKPDKKNKKNSKKTTRQVSQVLTKAALKGFDGIKISIPTQDLNMPPHLSPPYENGIKTQKHAKGTTFTKSSNKSEVASTSAAPVTTDIYEFQDEERPLAKGYRVPRPMNRVGDKSRSSSSEDEDTIKNNTFERVKLTSSCDDKVINKKCGKNKDKKYKGKGKAKGKKSRKNDHLNDELPRESTKKNRKNKMKVEKLKKKPVEKLFKVNDPDDAKDDTFSNNASDEQFYESDAEMASLPGPSGFVPDRNDESSYESDSSSPPLSSVLKGPYACTCLSEIDSDDSETERGCAHSSCRYSHLNAAKNAVMGKIFKNNAVRYDKTDDSPEESPKPKPDLDRLFDSLLEPTNDVASTSSMIPVADSSSANQYLYTTPKSVQEKELSNVDDGFSSPNNSNKDFGASSNSLFDANLKGDDSCNIYNFSENAEDTTDNGGYVMLSDKNIQTGDPEQMTMPEAEDATEDAAEDGELESRDYVVLKRKNTSEKSRGTQTKLLTTRSDVETTSNEGERSHATKISKKTRRANKKHKSHHKRNKTSEDEEKHKSSTRHNSRNEQSNNKTSDDEEKYKSSCSKAASSKHNSRNQRGKRKPSEDEDKYKPSCSKATTSRHNSRSEQANMAAQTISDAIVRRYSPQPSTSRQSDEGISTSHDNSADASDPPREQLQNGVAEGRARRKCTVGKQNVLAEHWSSSESEPEAGPSRIKGKKAPAGKKTIKIKKERSRESDGEETDNSRAVVVPKVRARASSTSETRVAPDEQTHGWVVGASHKKLVSMLAKGKVQRPQVEEGRTRGRQRLRGQQAITGRATDDDDDDNIGNAAIEGARNDDGERVGGGDGDGEPEGDADPDHEEDGE